MILPKHWVADHSAWYTGREQQGEGKGEERGKEEEEEDKEKIKNTLSFPFVSAVAETLAHWLTLYPSPDKVPAMECPVVSDLHQIFPSPSERAFLFESLLPEKNRAEIAPLWGFLRAGSYLGMARCVDYGCVVAVLALRQKSDKDLCQLLRLQEADVQPDTVEHVRVTYPWLSELAK